MAGQDGHSVTDDILSGLTAGEREWLALGGTRAEALGRVMGFLLALETDEDSRYAPRATAVLDQLADAWPDSLAKHIERGREGL